MEFGILGINYNKAKLDIRDQVAFTDSMKIEFMQAAADFSVEQCMILSTCNRSEVYFFYEEEWQYERMKELYRQTFPGVTMTDYLMSDNGKAAIAYLYRVAAGLESLVLGEDQILGQLGDALDFARTMGHSKKELNKVVRDAITCAKRIKTELKISEKPLSVSYVGIRELKKRVGICGKNVLLIGSGKAAVLALKYLCEYQAAKITVCSRNYSHAKAIKEEFPKVKVISYEQRYEVLADCEIVISATASPHLVLRKEEAGQILPEAFLDLATPRDIDPAFAQVPGITFLNLDTLLDIVEKNQMERQRLVEESRHMIRDAVEETMEWLKISRMDETIESLQQRCSEIVEDSCGYLNRKMELSPREQKLLKKVLNASLQRLLHEPIQELKQLESTEEQDTYKELMERLFQLKPSEHETDLK
ncbi:MAG: glutamyl-tRNA reductase [Roseburia sp.]